MTDTTNTAAVERLSPYAVDGGADAYGQMEEDSQGDYVTYEDYAALSAQLTAANQRAEMLADSVAKARAKGKAEGLREAAGAADKIGSHCISCGHVCGDPENDLAILRKAGASSCCPEREIESLSAAIPALIPADTPACDTKTAENVTQDALCEKTQSQDPTWEQVKGYHPIDDVDDLASKWLIQLSWARDNAAGMTLEAGEVKELISLISERVIAEPAKVTVQQAAKGALMVDHIDIVTDACRTFKLSEPHFRAALRTIAGGRNANS